MTWYCRLLTAGHLKLHKEEFSPFIDDGVGDVDAFCAREVEPIGKECEQVRYGSAAGQICNFRHIRSTVMDLRLFWRII
jgi:hypothetical protein